MIEVFWYRETHSFEIWTGISHLREGQSDGSADEVHHNQMEDRVSEEEVGKSSFWGDGQEVAFVLWVDLDAKTNCKTKKQRKYVKSSRVIQGEEKKS